MNPANPAEIRIVVADDHPEVPEGTALLLENAGYPVVRASGGEEALAAVRQHRSALLLVARDLPGTAGLEVCRRLKRDPALADVLVIILAGDGLTSDETAEGLEAGADGIIVRPIANRELLARVAAYARILRVTRSLRLQAEELRASDDKFKGFFEQMETKDHLENLFSSANAPIVVWDAAGHIARLNPAFETRAGLAAADTSDKSDRSDSSDPPASP